MNGITIYDHPVTCQMFFLFRRIRAFFRIIVTERRGPFFCNIVSESRRRLQFRMMSAVTPDLPVEPTNGATRTPKLRIVRPRTPARPHKKLSEEVLKVRVTDTKRRLQILQSKAVLMQDRLDVYEREIELRTT